ncbi:DNA mismatch repair protein MutS2 [Geosporobacter subterraneus DSM 17957]|uniref:Endonuclease MutS2 n=1 Tax=Geosporobacter subterraneus DSM 17957 TaxID=1121919 RepID=A0A1M6MQC1_9FIRM|nr:endonuclease MutS2 [Geosporobacter subterraneus]SHJ85634.1 DNA mismatch repair protein MutS2 [Geosporobacter subterraneus DSM 17957]
MNTKTLRVLEYEKIKSMLLQKVESSIGKSIAEQLAPSADLQEIVQWQKETSEASGLLIQKGQISMGGVHDLSYHIKRAEIGSFLYPGQLLEVADTLRAARRLKAMVKDTREEDRKYPIIEGYINSLYSFKTIEDRITDCIISEEEISDNASPTLKNIRRQIEAKNAGIRSRLNNIISSAQTQKYLQEAIITIRQDRYVVPVKQEYRANFPGLIHDQSSSGATLFIEPMAIVEMNNELKELKLKEKAEIERILAELTAMVGDKAEEIKTNQKLLAHLDFLFAKGKLSIQMRGVEPELNETGKIRIKNGRHPLLDAKAVVPTNIWLGEDFQTLVITGPNTGGKTVTLKTVGLLTLMAQSGFHVPADFGTRLSVFQQVFADIGDEQSIEQSLSTFSSHMTNIVEILNRVENNALILLDELGAGTDPTEGAALAIAILNHLYGLGARTIATTHYTELKQYALTTKGVKNASVEFDVETLSPTYRLLIGVPGKSNAFEISKRLGLDQYIIDRAKEFITKDEIEFEDLLTSIEKNKLTAEREKDEAIRLKLMIQEQKEDYERKLEKLSEQREKLLREAKEEARKLLKEAKEEAEEIIKELRALAVEQEEKEKNRKIEEARKKLRDQLDTMGGGWMASPENVVNTRPPKQLKLGDTVHILTLNQKGSVATLPDHNGDLTVQVGIMKVNVNMNHLRLEKEEKEKVSKTGTGKIMKSKSQSIQSSLDLRGQMLEEALLNTDKYLDDAYIAGLREITIIHGKGTGVLRDGIKQLLKGHKHVKSYRDGAYGEGGTGVTIAELK